MQAEAKFYLEKRKDKSGELITLNVPIFLFYSFDGQRLQYYTGHRVDADLWDDGLEKQLDGSSVRKHPGRVKSKHPSSGDINRELCRLKSDVEEIHNKARALGEELSLEDFRERLKGGKSQRSHHDFVECFEKYIKVSALTKVERTVGQIKSTLNIFKEFSADTRTALTFKNITQEFYDKFLEWCFETKHYYNAFTGFCVMYLKAFLNWATDQGYNTNLQFRKKSFRKLREEPEIIFLNHEELMKLYKYDFSANPEWEQVRDMFCFGCFMGMRHSDIAALSPQNVHKDFIQYRIVKTKQNNNIPLNPYSKNLLERNSGKQPGKCFCVRSLKQTNELLRKLFAEAEFNRLIEQTHYRGAKRVSESNPLCEVITFHISKKTFMTNFLAKGGSLLTAMSITGNKDMATAKRYYKVVDSLKQAEMAKVFGSVAETAPQPKKKRKAA